MTLIIILLLIVGIPIVGLFIRVWREDSQKNREAEEAAREKVRQAEETQEEFRQKQAEEKQNREALCARMANHPVFRQITSGLEEFVDDILEVAKTTVILSSVCEVIRVEVKNDSVIASHVLNEQVLSKREYFFSNFNMDSLDVEQGSAFCGALLNEFQRRYVPGLVIAGGYYRLPSKWELDDFDRAWNIYEIKRNWGYDDMEQNFLKGQKSFEFELNLTPLHPKYNAW